MIDLVRSNTISKISESAVLVLLSYTVLWRGGKSLESTWLLLGVSVLCLLILLYRETYLGKHPNGDTHGFRPAYLFVILLLYTILTAVSYIGSSTLNYGLDEVLRTAGVCFLVIWLIARSDHDTHSQQTHAFDIRIVHLIAALTVAACLIGCAVYLLQPVDRFVGTFFDHRFHTDYWPNAFADYLLLAWPMVLLSLQGNSRFSPRHKGLMTFLLSGFVVGCLMLSYSRGAIIAFAGQVVLLTALLVMARKNRRSIAKQLGVIVIALLIGCTVFSVVNFARSYAYDVQSVAEKATFTASEGRSSVDERASFWKQSLHLTMMRPILGWGPYSFRFVQPQLQTSVLTTSDHPHNVFLKLSTERGILVALLFAYLVVFALWRGVQLTISGTRFNKDFDRNSLAYPFITCSIAGVVAHSLIDYNLQFVGIALPFWLLMGMLLRDGAPHRTARTRSAEHSMAHKLALHAVALSTLLAAIFFVIAFREGAYLVTSSFGRHAEARGEITEALSWYEFSLGEWFSRDMELSMAGLYGQGNRIDDGKAVIERYLRRNDQDHRAWSLLGSLLGREDRFTDSTIAYEEAFVRGGWNDLRISRALLEALLADDYDQRELNEIHDEQRRLRNAKLQYYVPLIEERALAFKDAILQNLHFTALSTNPEEAVRVFITLAVLLPEKAALYKQYVEAIEAHAELERSRIASRPPGWLW